jgi:hypothetical protein
LTPLARGSARQPDKKMGPYLMTGRDPGAALLVIICHAAWARVGLNRRG